MLYVLTMVAMCSGHYVLCVDNGCTVIRAVCVVLTRAETIH